MEIFPPASALDEILFGKVSFYQHLIEKQCSKLKYSQMVAPSAAFNPDVRKQVFKPFLSIQ
jgi:hypothetical protein